MDFKTKLLAVRCKIYRFAISILNNSSDAEDVAQDICEKMWRDRLSMEHIENLDGFAMSSLS